MCNSHFRYFYLKVLFFCQLLCTSIISPNTPHCLMDTWIFLQARVQINTRGNRRKQNETISYLEPTQSPVHNLRGDQRHMQDMFSGFNLTHYFQLRLCIHEKEKKRMYTYKESISHSELNNFKFWIHFYEQIGEEASSHFDLINCKMTFYASCSQSKWHSPRYYSKLLQI